MINIENIRNVDAHTKGFRGKHNNGLTVKKCLIRDLFIFTVHRSIVLCRAFCYTHILNSQLPIDVIYLAGIRKIDNGFLTSCNEFCNSLHHKIYFGFSVRLLRQSAYGKVNIITHDITNIHMPPLTVQIQTFLKIVNDIIFSAIYSGRSQAYNRKLHLRTVTRLILANSRDIVAKKPIIDTKIPSPRGNEVRFIHNHKTNDSLPKKLPNTMCKK